MWTNGKYIIRTFYKKLLQVPGCLNLYSSGFLISIYLCIIVCFLSLYQIKNQPCEWLIYKGSWNPRTKRCLYFVLFELCLCVGVLTSDTWYLLDIELWKQYKCFRSVIVNISVWNLIKIIDLLWIMTGYSSNTSKALRDGTAPSAQRQCPWLPIPSSACWARVLRCIGLVLLAGLVQVRRQLLLGDSFRL